VKQLQTIRFSSSVFLGTVFTFFAATGVGHAQSARCSAASPRAVGLSLGRVSPYLELSRGAVDADVRGSILVRSGVGLIGRGDLPIAGPWRVRVEASTETWRVERQTYGQDFQVSAIDTIGHFRVREFVGMIGRQGGRSPVCGYVLGGGGIYALDFRGTTIRRPGVAMTTGVEVPTGERGAVQADVRLHIINTQGRYPIASSDVLAASVSVGWSYRF
jgi:hypothetical protein